MTNDGVATASPILVSLVGVDEMVIISTTRTKGSTTNNGADMEDKKAVAETTLANDDSKVAMVEVMNTVVVSREAAMVATIMTVAGKEEVATVEVTSMVVVKVVVMAMHQLAARKAARKDMVTKAVVRVARTKGMGLALAADMAPVENTAEAIRVAISTRTR